MYSISALAWFAILVGATVANVVFKEGYEYEYRYVAKAVAGIPNIKNQYGGVLLNGQIKVQRQDPAAIFIKIERLQSIEVHGAIPTDDSTEKLVDDFLQHGGNGTVQDKVELTNLIPGLQEPVRVQYSNGKIGSFHVSNSLPVYGVNLLKGILSMYVLDTGSYDQMVAKDQDEFFNFAIQEEDVAGKCESDYSIGSLPYQYNQNEHVLNVTKIRNYLNCEEMPAFYHQTAQNQDCRTCHDKKQPILSHMASIKYDLRGSENFYEFERIESQGQMLHSPYTAEADSYLTNTSRVLVFKYRKEIHEAMKEPSNGHQHHSLVFRFPAAEAIIQQLNSGNVNLHKPPPTPFYEDEQRKAVTAQDVAELLKAIATQIHNLKDEKDNNVMIKIVIAKKLMRALSYQEVEQVYQEVDNFEFSAEYKRVAHDVMVMAGSAPNILLLMKLIETNKIQGQEAALIIQQIPTTAVALHAKLIDEFKELLKSDVAKNNYQIYSTILLSFGTMIGTACSGSLNTRKTSSYLVENAFCSEKMKQHFLNKLSQELNNAKHKWEKIVAIEAIGNTLTADVLDSLRPFVSGKSTNCSILRSKAIYALTGVAKLHPSKVIKVLSPIFFNTEENLQVRVAALSILISAQPGPQFLNKVAVSTWREPSKQMISFIESSLKSLSKIDSPCLKEIKNNAKQALEMINSNFDFNIFDSKSLVHDDNLMEKYNVFNLAQLAWIRGKESVFPTEIFAKLNTSDWGSYYQLFSSSINVKGLGEIINRLTGPKSALYQTNSLEGVFQRNELWGDKYFLDLVEKLGINTEVRQSSDFMANLYIKFFDTQARNFYISKETLLDMFNELKNKLQISDVVAGKEININYHKFFYTREELIEFPLTLGLSVAIKSENPLMFYVNGKVKAKLDLQQNSQSQMKPKAVSLTANLQPIIMQSTLAGMCIMMPFNYMLAGTAFNMEAMLAVPVNTELKYDFETKKIGLTIGKCMEKQCPKKTTPIAQFKVEPFTVVSNYLAGKSINMKNKTIMVISNDRNEQVNHVYGDKSFGMPILIQGYGEQTEMTSPGAFIDHILKNGVWNMINEWNKPRSRQVRQYSVFLLDTAETQMVEIEFNSKLIASKLHPDMQKSSVTLNGLWSYLAGWSDLPTPCKAADQLIQDNQKSEEDHMKNYIQDENADSLEDQSNRNELKQKSPKNYWNDWQDYANDEHYNSKSQLQKSKARSADNNDDGNDNSRWSSNGKLDDVLISILGIKNSSHLTNNENVNDESAKNDELVKIETFKMADDISGFNIQLKAKMIGTGPTRSITVSVEGTKNLAQMKEAIKVDVQVMSPALQANMLKICAEAETQYPLKPCSYESNFNPLAIGHIESEAKITWGQNCNSENIIKVNAKASKSKKQLASEQAGNEWYYKQCLQERKQGLKLGEGCSKLYHELNLLNKVDYKIKYNNVPVYIRNIANKLDDVIKYKLSPHMSNNAMDPPNEKKEIRILAEFELRKNVVNLKIQKPTETTELNEVKTMLRSPSASHRRPERIVDVLTGKQWPATCDISGGMHIKTFNNVSYMAQLGQCTYLTASDCSQNGLFRVLVSGFNQASAGNLHLIDVYVMENKIRLHANSYNSQNRKVEINGKDYELKEEDVIVIRNAHKDEHLPDVFAYIALSGPFITVKSPLLGFEVTSNGKSVRTKVANLWSGKTCGLCGNYDGDSKDEFESPQGGFFSESADMLESYIIPNDHCENNVQQADAIHRQVFKGDNNIFNLQPQLNQDGKQESSEMRRGNTQDNLRRQQERWNTAYHRWVPWLGPYKH